MKLILALIALILVACSAPDRTTQTLKMSGFTDIRITGWAPFSCSKDDQFCTGFTAKNINGMEVSGAVGCGLIFKNCTVRF